MITAKEATLLSTGTSHHLNVSYNFFNVGCLIEEAAYWGKHELSLVDSENIPIAEQVELAKELESLGYNIIVMQGGIIIRW